MNLKYWVTLALLLALTDKVKLDNLSDEESTVALSNLSYEYVERRGLATGALVGIIIGCVVGLITCCSCICYFCCNCCRSSQPVIVQQSTTTVPSGPPIINIPAGGNSGFSNIPSSPPPYMLLK
ncbi:uncharacterized protein LOC111625926 [Centruroides sculpturatus]|uniref:uncharacterized protein LOC111625926 n=1 Tax=Centruroides sculpturatus TaxID=218467 RepID=UPI000C6E615F|nr:uncharacterized protein LOC111625926 [Centruroides sculpturatus]